MNLLASFADLETPLREPLDEGIHIDAKDKGLASELQRVVQFRTECRMFLPHVMIVGVPNAAKRGMAAQRQVKREGLLTGFPDLIALAPGKVAFLEFKGAATMPSQAQIDCLNRLARMGWPVGVFRRADSAVAWLRRAGF